MESSHIAILVEPILTGLIEPFLKLSQDSTPHWIVDCTLGGGGHTAAFLNTLNSDSRLRLHRVLALDQDLKAVERARERFRKEIEEGRLEVIHQRFGEAAEWVGSRPVLGLMADLGFSSDQLGDPTRGLSFQSDGPLDMRLDPSRGMSCRDLLIQCSESELEAILREYGEERFSRQIASAIVKQRRMGVGIDTTHELVSTVIRAIPAKARHGKIHAATRTFQAFRIAVNEELSQLDALLGSVIGNVLLGGRVAILSFHSLEDRKVKQAFKAREKFQALTKKPIQADEKEVGINPRSRSAKLRIAERIS